MIFDRLKQGYQSLKNALHKTKEKLKQGFQSFFARPLDLSRVSELEELLYGADLGREVVEELLRSVNHLLREKNEVTGEDFKKIFKETIEKKLPPDSTFSVQPPEVIFMVGVNGSGKTTTCAKLANFYHQQGLKVMCAAADTFRAAAVEQMQHWADKIGVPCIRGKMGGDPSAVVYDAISSFKSKGADLLLIDTAGRLENKQSLMEELSKMRRVHGKLLPGGSLKTLCTLDASIGQSALSQVEAFHKEMSLSGLVITKLDGTAKGGAVISVYGRVKTPLFFIGTGEKMEDIALFNKQEFVDSLF